MRSFNRNNEWSSAREHNCASPTRRRIFPISARIFRKFSADYDSEHTRQAITTSLSGIMTIQRRLISIRGARLSRAAIPRALCSWWCQLAPHCYPRLAVRRLFAERIFPLEVLPKVPDCLFTWADLRVGPIRGHCLSLCGCVGVCARCVSPSEI